MSLEEFIKSETLLLAQFKEYWREQENLDPEVFSQEHLSEGDWLEQFKFWKETKNCND